MWRQQWAIIRRYGILLKVTPIRSTIRLLLWPGLLVGLAIFLTVQLPQNNSGGSKLARNSFAAFIPPLLLWTTIFQAYAFTELLTKDKSSGMKSLMTSMGLKRFNYYCSMSICFIAPIMVISLIAVVISKVYIFDDTVATLTFLTFFVLFPIHLDAFVSLAVSLITSPSYAFILGSVLFLEGLIRIGLSYVFKLYSIDAWKPLILFLISISPYEAIRQLVDGYINDHPSEFNLSPESSPIVFIYQNRAIIIAEQLFWIVTLKLFAVWFEEVCPWQQVSAVRSPLFCFSKKDDRYNANDDMPVSEPTGEYFEPWDARNRVAGIKIYSVNKSFNKVPAVSDLSFTVYKGETTFLLGHNGAGKSTLINMILGLLTPDGGRVRIKSSMSSSRVGSIGVCPQKSVLDDNLSVQQHLELFNDIKSNIAGNEKEQHVRQTISDMSLVEHKDKRPSELSGGMRRKLSLGMAFVGMSEVLLLDEPSSGLDPDSRMFIWDVIRRYRAERTVLLSTQHMEEADYLGDRIAIMSSGRMICCGSSVFLKNKFGTSYKLRIECKLGKRDQIVGHIRQFFDGAHPVSEFGEMPDSDSSDFVVELKKSSGDNEKAMMKLLEDLENNSKSLGILSHGLKSSSIEDVMLHTSKYLGIDSSSTRLTVSSTSNQLNVLAKSKQRIAQESKSSAVYRVLRALVIKQLQVYRAHWLIVLLTKVLLPVIGAFFLARDLNGFLSFNSYWQSVSTPLMICHFIFFPVRERVSKFKIMQLESDATFWLYWMAQVLVDLLGVGFILICINIFLITSITGYLEVSQLELNLLVSVATLVFCFASLAFCYLLSTIITDYKSSIGTVWIICIMSSLVFILIFMLRLVAFDKGQQWLQDMFGYISLILSPVDAYRLFLVALSHDCYILPRPGMCTKSNIFMPPMALSFLLMFMQTLIYGYILVLVEYQKIDMDKYFKFANWVAFCKRVGPAIETSVREIDDDVKKETERAVGFIEVPSDRSNCLVAAKLDKSYIKGKQIIRNLSFGVHKGECFGLLGVNGAGKSTTFSMLVGDTPPDSGRLLANGHFLAKEPQKYRTLFGYDPQADPELSLTPDQALRLMARLRGVPEENVSVLVESVLELLSMSEHAYKLDSQLSGGTKRKLTLGMALIGNPLMLALDEPTAGVDPLARRSVWRLLRSLRTRNESSIIISSHAMEECEAICDRIAIMARGRLRCIGTFLHLRSKFARGCSLRVQYTRPHAGLSASSDSVTGGQLSDEIVAELTRKLGDAIGPSTFKLADRNVKSVTFQVLDNRVRRSLLFKVMCEFRKKQANLSYMINDSSLEDIFVSLAKEQQELERQATPQPTQSSQV